MTTSNYFKCECGHCHGHIEFPAGAAGATVECPHCQKQTTLAASGSQSRFSSAHKLIFISVIIGIFLAAAFARWLIIRSQQAAQQEEHVNAVPPKETNETANVPSAAEDPIVQAGWRASSISLEKMAGSTIVHAVGTLTNETDRRRFGVKIQVDLFDSASQKIESSTDYQPTVEARAEWKFHALVVNSKVDTAKIATVEESP